MANKEQSLVPIACLVKRHTFKENKWKAIALSGLASHWFEKLNSIFIQNQSIPVKIEVPLSHSSEFFIHFADDFAPPEKAQISVERSSFPALENSDFYLCDLIGAAVDSDEGLFKVVGYFENGDPSRGVTTLTVQLESLEKDKKLSVEVPLQVLKRKENSWFIEDVGLWIDVSTKHSADERDE